jgi:hypothetical protein
MDNEFELLLEQAMSEALAKLDTISDDEIERVWNENLASEL